MLYYAQNSSRYTELETMTEVTLYYSMKETSVSRHALRQQLQNSSYTMACCLGKHDQLSHLIFQRKPNASHMWARIKFTHMIDVISEISINSHKNVQELNHYIISLLHSDDRLEGLYNEQTITMKTQHHLHLPQASDWVHASLRTPRSCWSTPLQCSSLNNE
jgi:hypothetical protein